MNVLLKVYNRIILVLLLSVLYFNLFLISSLYDIDKTTHKHNYTSYKNIKSLNLKQSCEIFECNSIRKENIMYHFDKNIFLYKTQINTNNIHIFDNYYIDIEEFSLNIKTHNGYVYVDLLKNIDKMITIILFSIPLLILIFSFAVGSTIIEEQKENIIKIAGNEAILTNKSMIMITENIHHELNTPLEIIDNKFDKLKRKINKLDPLKLVEVEEDFEFIDTSTAQIRNILNKMREFKEIRYSKKDENIYDILNKAFKMVSMSISNYEYSIDKYFKRVNLDNKLLSTSDLLNIVINHIKNSLEADASKIYIIHEKLEGDFCYIRIIDNGTGIPEDIQKKIFEPNFSTKNDFEGLRGNGMYLNKQIMLNGEGNIKLISSTNKGTTIGLKFKINKKNIKNG